MVAVPVAVAVLDTAVGVGASSMSVRANMVSLARLYSTHRRRDSRSMGLSFQRLVGSSRRAWKRRSCSSSLTLNQYLMRRMPLRMSIRSKSGQERRNSSYCSEVQKPMTCSTPVEEHHFAGRGKLLDVTLEVPLGPLPVVGYSQRHHPHDAVVTGLEDSLDDSALARSVTAFEDRDDPELLLADPSLQFDQLDLET